jgi:hypothetical protein
LKRAFSIYTHILYLGDDGKYHIPYTYSDEYGNAKETSLNISLASWGYHTLIDCVERLKINEPLLAVWKDRLNNLADINTNEICRVSLKTTKPLMIDSYRDNRSTGSFILIDDATNETVAAGMII